MKRTALIGLILITLGSTTGIQIIFSSYQHAIRKQMKHLIKNSVSEDDLFEFKFTSANDPYWTRKGKEFRVGEQMYDVVQTEEHDGHIIYNCVSDVQETELFANLGNMVRNNLGGEDSPNGNMLRNLFKLYACDEFPQFEYSLFLFEFDESACFNYLKPFSSSSLDIDLPPPELVNT